MNDETELLPCPFCGSPARWAVSTEPDDSEIQCSDPDCALLVFGQKNTDAETVSAWNTRALTQRERELEATVERLSRPVSDEECRAGLRFEAGVEWLSRGTVDALIRARTEEEQDDGTK